MQNVMITTISGYFGVFGLFVRGNHSSVREESLLSFEATSVLPSSRAKAGSLSPLRLYQSITQFRFMELLA